MNDTGIIILLSLAGVVLIICLYWCFIHSQKHKKVNNKSRWELIKYLDKNPEVLPL